LESGALSVDQVAVVARQTPPDPPARPTTPHPTERPPPTTPRNLDPPHG
jgi:hypothetical protein